MHAAWYVNEDFIKKYGRIGRSWGCPAIPHSLIKPVVNTIKDQSLMIVYYPDDKWLAKSKFLTCENLSLAKSIKRLQMTPKETISDPRGPVLFADNNKNNKMDLDESVVVMQAENYHRIFNLQVPLNRMLRRQINKKEYIALNQEELISLDTNRDNIVNNQDRDGLKVIQFVKAVVKNKRGYWATEFHNANLGKNKKVRITNPALILSTEKANIRLKSTRRFIRWLGL